jgi:hypothetical protein
MAVSQVQDVNVITDGGAVVGGVIW